MGGSKNPDGSKKRAKLPPDEAEVRGKEAARKRVERKASLKARFLEHRAVSEKRKAWEGPRKFEEWLFALAEQEISMRLHERAAPQAACVPGAAPACVLPGREKEELKETIVRMYEHACTIVGKPIARMKRWAHDVGVEVTDHEEDYD